MQPITQAVFDVAFKVTVVPMVVVVRGGAMTQPVWQADWYGSEINVLELQR